jgi:hypothetical protein
LKNGYKRRWENKPRRTGPRVKIAEVAMNITGDHLWDR